ncbi:MAG: ATP-binding protein [Planctomycetota bacterium]
MDSLYLSVRQTRLHTAVPRLSRASSFRELCHEAVEVGIKNLGLPPHSIWSLADDGTRLRVVCRGDSDGVIDCDLEETRKRREPQRDERSLGLTELNEFEVGDSEEMIGSLLLEPGDHEITDEDRMIASLLADTVGHLSRRVLAEESLRELYRITSDSSMKRSERIEAILRMGLDRFDLEVAILARIVGNRYEVVQVVAPEELGLEQGDSFELGDTYCRETMAARGPVGFAMARGSNWECHPAYVGFGLEAYLGVPVHSGDELYGTLNFSSREPRPRTYTDFERELAQLMARWIQVELEQERNEKRIREHEAKLGEQSRSDTIGELATSLAHELNQPLAALVTLADAAKRAIDSDREPAVVKDDLIEINAQALRAHGIVRSLRSLVRREQTQRERCSIRDLLESIRSISQLELEAHDVSLHFDLHDPDAEVEVNRVPIEQAVRNLVQNSVDAIVAGHPPERTVTLRTRERDTRVEFEVTDSATLDPGANPDRIIDAFYTTRAKGLGLGLAIVRSVIEVHDSSLELERTEANGLRARFTVAR